MSVKHFLCTFSQAWQLTCSLVVRPSQNLVLHYGHPFCPIDCFLSPYLNLHLSKNLLHNFQTPQSSSSPSTSLWFSVKYFLSCPPWSILTTCPIHSNPFLIVATMYRTLNSSLNSWFVLILHIPCSITGAYILLNISPPMFTFFSNPSQSYPMFHSSTLQLVSTVPCLHFKC